MGAARQAIAWFLAVLVFAVGARAQGFRVTAEAHSERVTLGDSTLLRITVSGTTAPRRPELPAMDGLIGEYFDESTSTSVQIINGRRTDSIERTYRFRITPTREGALRIPPVIVRAGGEERATPAIWIVALEPGAHPDYALKVMGPERAVYVGEPVVVTLRWYLGGQFRGPSFAMLDGPRGYVLSPGPDPRRGRSNIDARQFAEFTFLGQPTVGQWGSGLLGERTVQTFEFAVVLTPTSPGMLTFGPVHIAFDRPVQSGRDVFDRTLLQREQTERVVIASEALRMEAKALPREGRPANFSGLVGRYSLATSAVPRTVHVGDPISLTLRITGPDVMPPIEAPDVSNVEEFAEGFRLSPDGWRAEVDPPMRQRVFTTVIRAASEAVTRIPPIELSFFDPEFGEYRVARSEEIPLAVAATRLVTADDALRASEASAGRKREPLTPGPMGLLANAQGPSVLVDRAGVRRWEWAAAAMLGIGAPAMFAAAVAASRRREPTRHQRRLRGLRRAAAAARTARNDPARIEFALRLAASAILNVPVETVTSHDAARLSGMGFGSAGASLARAIERLEARRFGPDGGAGSVPSEEAGQIISDLRRCAGRIA